MGTTIILLVAAGVAAVAIIGIYNGLIKLKNKCEEAWSDIDTQLKRRYDLIPNLVETVKGYASHEKETLEKVIQARSSAMNAEGFQAKEQAENMLTSALKTIFALSENYPDLKANTNFLELQNTLKEIEEHIQLSRRYYNATVRDFNTKIEVFPNNMLAGMFGFKKREFFQIDEEEKKNVKVDFNNKEESKKPEATKEPTEEPKEESKPEEQSPAASEESKEEPKEEPKPEEPKEAPKEETPQAEPTDEKKEQ